jgi:Ribonuclease G/E
VTDHDRDPKDHDDEPRTDGATTTTEETPSRTRTRTRSRGGASRAGRRDPAGDARAEQTANDTPAEQAANDAGDATDPSEDGSGSDEGHREGSRRRRRGRRGRGRGRGKGGATGDGEGPVDGDAVGDAEGEAVAAPDEPARSPTQAPAADDGGARRSGSSRSGRGKRSGSKSGGGGQRSTARGDGGGPKADAADGNDEPVPTDGDGEVEQAIARSGTRVAAKRGRRGGNGGGNRRSQQRPGGVPEEVRRAILEGPPRTMLVTAREDRTQIAVLEDRTVVEHYVTRKEDVTFVGNIYMARVQNVLPGMEAAFLDIGKGRNGVLYAGEVLYDELDVEESDDQRIENALKPGQKVLVQVTKDPMGSKGPRLTMHLSLAGRYMVLAPNSDLFGISRKLTDKERDRLRRVVKKVKPEQHGIIVRTAAEGATDEQLTADLERLLAKWSRVEEAAQDAKALTAVYEEPPLVVKVIRDNFGPEFERCIVDDPELYHQVRGYLDEVAPELLDKVELYGQPTLDARARAAGAPTAAAPPAADTSDAGGDGEVVADDAGAPDAKAGTPADQDAPTADTAVAEAGDGSDAPTAQDVAEPVEVEAVPEADATPDPVRGLTEAQLEAARERQRGLPKLFEAYDVADQLRKAMGRKVWLPSGGYLIIESTEAMKVIDVNTGKFTGGKDTNLEEVVLKTNLEAADEIVRQLRLRDMGGIIVIDFIDMLLKANQEQVVRRLKRELLRDRTKTRVSEVSRLGLVQMTRKNVSQGLVESFSHACEHCEGRGLISEID